MATWVNITKYTLPKGCCNNSYLQRRIAHLVSNHLSQHLCQDSLCTSETLSTSESEFLMLLRYKASVDYSRSLMQ